MEQPIAANRLATRVGKQWKREPDFFPVREVDFRRIDADGGEANSAAVKLGQALLKTPQLGVAIQSPMSAIENEQSPFALAAGARLASLG